MSDFAQTVLCTIGVALISLLAVLGLGALVFSWLANRRLDDLNLRLAQKRREKKW